MTSDARTLICVGEVLNTTQHPIMMLYSWNILLFKSPREVFTPIPIIQSVSMQLNRTKLLSYIQKKILKLMQQMKTK